MYETNSLLNKSQWLVYIVEETNQYQGCSSKWKVMIDEELS